MESPPKGRRSPSPPPSSPVAGHKRRRDSTGLRPGFDDELASLRAHTTTAAAPHSGALFADVHRNKAASGYPGQSHAHDALRASAKSLASLASPDSPVSPLEASLHLAASQLHVTLPGPDLLSAFPHGGYPLLKGRKKLSESAESAELAKDLHERREQVKQNWSAAAAHLPKKKRRRIALPSPPREPLAHGGGYIDPPSPTRAAFDDTDGGGSVLSVEEQRKKARDVMTPLLEPSWAPAARGKGERPPAFHGRDVSEVVPLFIADTSGFHKGEVASAATADYLASRQPSPAKIRVKSVPSSAFHAKKRRAKAAGAHEVLPTDEAPTIAALPDHSRSAFAYTQADVRTNTALTFFRGLDDGGSRSSSGSGSDGEKSEGEKSDGEG